MFIARDSNETDLVDALDEDGRKLSRPVSRAEAHRKGIWHRSLSVFVMNRHGEVLVERRSENKDLFPGCYDIVGGHLAPNQSPLDAACREILEEVGLSVASDRITLLAPEDSVIERVILPDQAIVNLERKSVYLFHLTDHEENEVLRLAARLRRLTPDELEARGTSGEVSQIEFWSFELLAEACRAGSVRQVASGTISAFANDIVRANIHHASHSARNALRNEFLFAYPFVIGDKPASDEEDVDLILSDTFLDRPLERASSEEVADIFNRGTDEIAGAYQMGEFRQMVAGDERWSPKLRDAESRYTRNLLAAIASCLDSATRQELEQGTSDAQSFVNSLLNFPLSTGERFRDRLGNLSEIALGRKATLVWLKNRVSPRINPELLKRPTGLITDSCISVADELLEELKRTTADIRGRDWLRELLLSGLACSSTDFNNPAFQLHLRSHSHDRTHLSRFVKQNAVREFCEELGANHFLNDFYEKYIVSGRRVRITYLSGNAGQSIFGFAVIQELLKANANAEVRFISKAVSAGNDLTYEGAYSAISSCRLIQGLTQSSKEGRFQIEPDGPQCHGLDPASMSATVAHSLSRADVIVAEGQAYAEIRGWKTPTYVVFRVNGRVAEAIHGVPRKSAGFVRLTPGVYHFRGFSFTAQRSVGSHKDSMKTRPVQTTAAYVRAILSDNFRTVKSALFHDDELEACRQLSEEADQLGRTFADVVLGVGSGQPGLPEQIKTQGGNPFRVFACGGGGGFAAVTLRALRQMALPTVAGVPSTDDGGNTGELQKWLRTERGFVFGVGDMAAILQDAIPNRGKQALLAYRFDIDPESLKLAVMQRIITELSTPTYSDSSIGTAEDFLSFVCDQLNLARVLDERFRSKERAERLPIKGASIRNLNVIAAYELCGLLGDQDAATDGSRIAAFHVLQRALAIPRDLLVLPVTYSQGVLFLEYQNEISTEMAQQYGVPTEALGNERRLLYGQQYIDTLPQAGPRVRAGVVRSREDQRKPEANVEYLNRLRDAQLFVMGAGSLIGSQLSQLAIPGVVDVLLEQRAMRRVLVLNHVKMDETLGMSVVDQVRLIETVATENASTHLLGRFTKASQGLQIGDVFTDIVLPRTVAGELETEMLEIGFQGSVGTGELVEIAKSETQEPIVVHCNRYVSFLMTYPEIRKKYGVTVREMEVLSYLDQPRSLYARRSEKGRYRGALFATSKDIEFLVSRGIQRRSIHEVDSIGRIWKFVKSEGVTSIEEFPGLVPEALSGILRIALERASRGKSRL